MQMDSRRKRRLPKRVTLALLHAMMTLLAHVYDVCAGGVRHGLYRRGWRRTTAAGVLPLDFEGDSVMVNTSAGIVLCA